MDLVLAAVQLGARLALELEALLALKPLGLAMAVAASLGLAWLVSVAGPVAVRTAWRLGFDVRRRLGFAASASRVLALLIAVLGSLRPIFSDAPTIGTLLLLALLILAAIATPVQIRNLGAGLSLAARSRIREGDLIEIGDIEGTVRDIGLFRVTLRTAEGGTTHVPAADFDRLPVVVGSRRAALPVEAYAPVDPARVDVTMAAIRKALWFSPFRRADTELHLRHDPKRAQVEVRLDTWAGSAPAEVEQHLRALLARTIAEVEGPGAAPSAPAAEEPA